MTLLKRLQFWYSAWRSSEEKEAQACSSPGRPTLIRENPISEVRRLENARAHEEEKLRDFVKLGLGEMVRRSNESLKAIHRRLEALRLTSRRAA